ncbi:MAG: methylenetetrahydrofolate reductase [NAD(P)H] [Ruminococcaceae bacterium]|nr:methylenetetrahydrofolate reductase [NAD(P)H] [Oscillospiraceae bacterium]
MKTTELFKKKTTLSFEVFPPKPTSDESVIYKALDGMKDLDPDFISVTYGAGGGANCGKSVQIASDIKNKYHIESVAHLPCIALSEEDALTVLESLKNVGVENVLALRGDITPEIVPNGRFKHASDLIAFIRERFDFNIIAACYPEGHSESSSLEEDLGYVRKKVDCGASQLITQLFLDNDYFLSFREKARAAGISVPIEAGIMPVTNKAQIERMVKLCGVQMPKKFLRAIERYEHSPEALRDAGIAYAVDQIVGLLSENVDGVHLYTMNNPYVARRICEAVKSLFEV